MLITIGGDKMPKRDGTGPMGQGSMTGRGLGICTGANAGGYGIGLGRGRGFGIGLGFRCNRDFGGNFIGQYPGLTDKELLTEQKNFLQKRLDAISKQLENLSEDTK